MSSQHALFITQCNIGYLATIALVALLLWDCVTTIIRAHDNGRTSDILRTFIVISGQLVT